MRGNEVELGMRLRRVVPAFFAGKSICRLGAPRLALAASIAAAALLALPGVATATREYDFRGHAVNAGHCQEDLKVAFNATLHRGRFRHVKNFDVFDMNLPDETPPWPVGKPSGNCVPGDPNFSFSNYSTGRPAVMPFGEGDDGAFEFRDSAALALGGATVEEWKVHGKLTIRRRHHRFHLSAKGYLVWANKATCKASQRCSHSARHGVSSGEVTWKAWGHEVNPQ